MHSMVSNQGNGSTRGKAAWLCGGSYLGRLSKAGLVSINKTFERRAGEPVAYLTLSAEEILSKYAPNKRMKPTSATSASQDVVCRNP